VIGNLLGKTVVVAGVALVNFLILASLAAIGEISVAKTFWMLLAFNAFFLFLVLKPGGGEAAGGQKNLPRVLRDILCWLAVALGCAWLTMLLFGTWAIS
jgi:hypothetical protein